MADLGRHIHLSYPDKSSKSSLRQTPPYALNLEYLVDLNLKIRSNSSEFLKLLRRQYSLFLNQEVRKYYKRNFSTEKNIIIDVIFSNGNEKNILTAFADIERHIKCLLWGRFVILHASCVRYKGFNLFFMGGSGSGKSTICSAMCSYGARVLSDDYSLVEIATKRAYLFPTLMGAVRPGVRSEFQKKILMSLRRYKDISFASRMLTMKKGEFRAFLSYHKKMYGINKTLISRGFKKARNAFIVLKNNSWRHKDKVLLPKSPSDVLSDLIQNIALNPKYCNGLIRKSLGVFLNSKCYVLERAPLDLMTSVIYCAFK